MQIAAIGDIHGFWDDRDTAYFNASDYDALLFVGDFARITNSMPIARALAALDKPAWAIPGNHDAVSLPQLLSELKGWRRMQTLAGLGMARRVNQLARALDPIRLGGYTLDALGNNLGLLIARPHAMGSDRFYYRAYLKRRFGVADFKASAEQLIALVDEAPAHLIVLAHNGPAGLGDTPGAPFGCDFAPENGDFGDPDLRAAIDHAHATGRRVLAVVAGHMHHRSKHSGQWRQTWAHDGDTLYINAARVPRIENDGARRHHIALTLNGTSLTAETVFVDAAGTVLEREPIGPQTTAR